MFTAVYILRLIGRVFFGPLDERWRDVTDMNRREGFAAGILALVLILFGVFPLPLLRIINSGVDTLMSRLGEAL
jgi:NADH-quinone oxidoreductase subunit M